MSSASSTDNVVLILFPLFARSCCLLRKYLQLIAAGKRASSLRWSKIFPHSSGGRSCSRRSSLRISVSRRNSAVTEASFWDKASASASSFSTFLSPAFLRFVTAAPPLPLAAPAPAAEDDFLRFVTAAPPLPLDTPVSAAEDDFLRFAMLLPSFV